MRACAELSGLTLAVRLERYLGAALALVVGIVVGHAASALRRSRTRKVSPQAHLVGYAQTVGAGGRRRSLRARHDRVRANRLVGRRVRRRAQGQRRRREPRVHLGRGRDLGRQARQRRARAIATCSRSSRSPWRGPRRLAGEQLRQGCQHGIAQATCEDQPEQALAAAEQLAKTTFFAPHAEVIRMFCPRLPWRPRAGRGAPRDAPRRSRCSAGCRGRRSCCSTSRAYIVLPAERRRGRAHPPGRGVRAPRAPVSRARRAASARAGRPAAHARTRQGGGADLRRGARDRGRPQAADVLLHLRLVRARLDRERPARGRRRSCASRCSLPPSPSWAMALGAGCRWSSSSSRWPRPRSAITRAPRRCSKASSRAGRAPRTRCCSARSSATARSSRCSPATPLHFEKSFLAMQHWFHATQNPWLLQQCDVVLGRGVRAGLRPAVAGRDLHALDGLVDRDGRRHLHRAAHERRGHGRRRAPPQARRVDCAGAAPLGSHVVAAAAIFSWWDARCTPSTRCSMRSRRATPSRSLALQRSLPRSFKTPVAARTMTASSSIGLVESFSVIATTNQRWSARCSSHVRLRTPGSGASLVPDVFPVGRGQSDARVDAE